MKILYGPSLRNLATLEILLNLGQKLCSHKERSRKAQSLLIKALGAFNFKMSSKSFKIFAETFQ